MTEPGTSDAGDAEEIAEMAPRLGLRVHIDTGIRAFKVIEGEGVRS